MGYLNSRILQLVKKKKKKQQVSSCGNGATVTWREPFHILTTLLLSLLLPLSFLLLARLSTAHYLQALLLSDHYSTPHQSSHPTTFLSFLFLYTTTNNSTILYTLVSLVTVAAFLHTLTGRVALIKLISQSPPPEPVYRPRLYAAWILLCTLQVCVGLGIEGSIAAGIDGSGFNRDKSLLSRLIFFVGLHETMLFWSTSVVKPVVDDTVMGFAKEERWFERVAMALSLGTLWWWRLRDEVDSLVVVAELRRNELLAGIGLADFVGWWLYYLMVSTGIIRVMKGVIWLGTILLFRKAVETERDFSSDSVSDRAIEDKEPEYSSASRNIMNFSKQMMAFQ